MNRLWLFAIIQSIVAIIQVAVFGFLFLQPESKLDSAAKKRQEEIERLRTYFNTVTPVNGSKEEAQLQLLTVDAISEMDRSSTVLANKAYKLAIAAVVFSLLQVVVGVIQLVRR